MAKKGKYVPKIDLEVTYDHIKAAYEILTKMPEIRAEQLFEAKKIVDFSAKWIEKFEVDKNDLLAVAEAVGNFVVYENKNVTIYKFWRGIASSASSDSEENQVLVDIQKWNLDEMSDFLQKYEDIKERYENALNGTKPILLMEIPDFL